MWLFSARPALSNRVQIWVVLQNVAEIQAEKLHCFLTVSASGKQVPAIISLHYHKQTCSMPWGVLSLNVNSGKTWWSTVLLRIAPDCPCYNVLYDRGFLWWNDLNPMKIGKNPLESWIQGSARSSGSWAFFSKFWFVKGQNWSGCERGM